MIYRLEILYNDNTFDTVCTSKYTIALDLIKELKITSAYKDIRLYKIIGHYKNENMEIQHNN